MSNYNIEIVRAYFDAVKRGDLEAVGAALHDDLVWHQPGASSVSGRYAGKQQVFGLLGRFMEISQGSFRISRVDAIMSNGELVSAMIEFAAEANGRTMSMPGVDLFRLADGKIVECWLFSGDQDQEDAFWG